MSHSRPEDHPAAEFSTAELARRRRSATRLAWILGAIVLALYVGGLFVKR